VDVDVVVVVVDVVAAKLATIFRLDVINMFVVEHELPLVYDPLKPVNMYCVG